MSWPNFFSAAPSALVLGMIVSGCSLLPTFKKGGRELVLEPVFVRSTQLTESFSYRRLNRMTPIVTERAIIQGNAIDGLANYDRKTGREIWRIDLKNGVEGGAELAADTLFIGAGDGLLRSVDALSGKTNWSVPMRAELLAPPTLDRGILIAQTGADVVYGLEAQTGKLLWTYNRQVTGNLSVRSTTRPVVHEDNVLAGFSDGYLVALRKRDGVVQWERKLGKGNRFRDVDSTPAINGKKAYVASYDGLLVALNLDSGEVIWQSDFGGYLPVTIGTGAYADRLYFSTVDGRVLEIDEASGKELRAIKLSTGIATQPLISKNLLVYGESEGAIRILDLNTLKTVAHYSSGEGILSTPYLDTKKSELWFVSSAANLYGLKLSYRRVAERFPWKRLETAPTSSSF